MSLWDTALTEWNSDNEVSQEMQNISTAGNGSTKSGEEMKRNSITIQVDRQRVPLFIASNNFFVKDAQQKMRRLLVSIMSGSAVAAMFWSIRPFLGLGHHGKTSTTFLLGDNTSITNEGNPLAKSSVHFTNETSSRGQWNLIVDATYPWDTSTNPAYALTLAYQFYWIVFCMAQINLLDLLFCSWLIFACEQIGHLKDILHPLMELSRIPRNKLFSSLGNMKSGHGVMDEIFYQHSTLIRNGFPSIPKTFSVLRSSVMAQDESTGLTTEGTFGHQRNIVSPYLGKGDNIIDNPHAALEAIGRGMFRANDTKAVIQKATKYWVEKHKHIVRFVECIGDSYGMALLIHMLTSTIALTLLSYEATKISSVDMHALTVITYLLYTLGQVFLFCIYGNNLIEESTSVMQAAYDSPWYECTEEAKAFIQIVCQQSQRPMSVSGAKFFTVSLDLFASVLGAVVTYFMVLIQLK
ncbi:odorant receptor coreceptor-like [Ischnura elegans]|uniref:odorant receptor coreceptor-like n=1 Tax=Ischnura elegans TaxID=197161 RepID=UPI001ED898E6|nr:odorant receptor coreceptor-like [Ischnura elegans]